MIPYLDLKPKGHLAEELNSAYDRVFNSGRYIGGYEVEAFESEWSEYTQSKYCVGVGNGHDALSLAVKYYSRRYVPVPVFVPWKTCLPTWAAVKSGGGLPRPFQEIPHDLTIAVHIYGQITLPTDSEILIEDCAQAHGSKYNGIPAGKFGKVAAFSFYPSKNLGALGDAGAVTTDDEEIYNFVKSMRNYGTPDQPGINSRFDPLQAAFLRVKLPYLDRWNKQRAESAWTYMTINNPLVELPKVNLGDEPNWHIFAIETDRRDELKSYLFDNGVGTMIHYPVVPYPNHWKIPEAESWVKRTLTLPVANLTSYQCKKIGELINQWKPS
jgi:dTDP-4-amino-4,6-dideoxygalactose transaminase